MPPEFLILGAARSGTTALHAYLNQHPDVYMPLVKEPHFFAYGETAYDFKGPGDDRFVHTSLSRSDYGALFVGARPNQMRGDASATSLYVPRAAQRIERYVPEARMIAVLRDPVERAFSNYLLLVRDGREPCDSFADALNREAQRIRADWEHGWHYVQLGFYHDQLRRFYNRFDRDQIRVVLFEDFTDDPTGTVQQIYRFLEVDDTFVPDTSMRHNPSGRPRSWSLHWLLQLAGVGAAVRRVLPDRLVDAVGRRAEPVIRQMRRWKKHVIHRNLDRPSLPPEPAARLRNLYRDDIHRLESLIDRDLSHWLED